MVAWPMHLDGTSWQGEHVTEGMPHFIVDKKHVIEETLLFIVDKKQEEKRAVTLKGTRQ